MASAALGILAAVQSTALAKLSPLSRQLVLWLSAVRGMGNVTLGRIINAQINTEETLHQIYTQSKAIRALCISEKIAANIKKFKNEYTYTAYAEWLNQRGWRPIYFDDDLAYPPLLRQLTNGPLILYARGARVHWHDLSPVAVIGSRQMTSYGQLVVRWLVPKLASAGCLVVSGAMVGVDMAAHAAAVEAGAATVGFLGYGFGWVYPRQLESRFAALLERGGTLLTQFSPMTPPSKGSFIARNRVVAGSCQAVLVVEAAVPSGTFSTVNWALAEGREVLAVPGPITSPYSEGTKQLLSQGAVLVSTPADVLAVLSKVKQVTSGQVARPTTEAVILEWLKTGPASLEQISQNTALHLTELTAVCTQLEITGQVVRLGNRWALLRQS